MTDYIANMDISQPDGQKQRKGIHPNVRDTKQTIYNTLKNLTGPVTSTHTELNYIRGSAVFYPWHLNNWESKLLQPTTTDGWRYFLTMSPLEAPSNYNIYPWRIFLTFPSTNASAAPRLIINGQTTYLKGSAGTSIAQSGLATGKIYKLIYVLESTATATYRIVNL